MAKVVLKVADDVDAERGRGAQCCNSNPIMVFL